MTCPNCGKEMETGSITAGGYRIIWTCQHRRFSASLTEGDETIQPLRLLGKLENTAYLCRSCRKLIVDY